MEIIRASVDFALMTSFLVVAAVILGASAHCIYNNPKEFFGSMIPSKDTCKFALSMIGLTVVGIVVADSCSRNGIQF